MQINKYMVVAASMLASNAYAGNFEGFDIAIGLAVQNNNYGGGGHSNNGGAPTPFPTVNRTDANARFDLGYNFTLAQKYVLGIQGSLQPFESNDKYSLKTGGTLSSNKSSGRYDISLLPGILLSPDTLLYGKLGYSYAQRNVSNLNGAWSDTLHYNGIVTGIGAKTAALGKLLGNDNLYAFAECNIAYYGDQHYRTYNNSGNLVASTALGLSTRTALVGVGYSF